MSIYKGMRTPQGCVVTVDGKQFDFSKHLLRCDISRRTSSGRCYSQIEGMDPTKSQTCKSITYATIHNSYLPSAQKSVLFTRSAR